MNHLMNDETGPERPVPDGEPQTRRKATPALDSKEIRSDASQPRGVRIVKRHFIIPREPFAQVAKSVIR